MTIDREQQPSSRPFYNAPIVARLAGKAIRRHKTNPPTERVMIAISGVPGSGKTSLATAVAAEIEASCGRDCPTVIVPMDGFHLYRSQLAAMPNPAEAVHRRGAAFTFDAERFHQLARALREPVTGATPAVYAPSFDHAVKDPVEDDVEITREARVVIFEGLYLSLDREPWGSAARLMDELWFLHVDSEVARARLIKRHVASGIVPDEEAARHRVSSTDQLNADDILSNRLPVDELICL